MARPQIHFTQDELRRAFTLVFVATGLLSDRDADDAAGYPVHDALARAFPIEQVDALAVRVTVLMMWLEFGDSEALARKGEPPLNVPEIHPAVLDVCATTVLPKYGLPPPRRVHREIERRLLSYDVLSAWL